MVRADPQPIGHQSLNISNLIILMNFFRQLPKEIEEAAQIDGCNYFGMLMKIALPVMRRVFMPPERARQPILYSLFHGQPGQLAEPRGLLSIWGKPRLVPLARRLKTHR